MAATLRDYQLHVDQEALSRFSNGLRRGMIVMPTGTGKTQTFLSIAHNWPQGHVLVMAHREELIWQPWRRWKQIYGEYGDIEMAEYRRPQLSLSNITFASKDTLYRERRLKGAFPDPKKVGLIIIDEAHHAVRSNKTYQKVLDYFDHPDLCVLGVTATPDRADEKALGQTFDEVIFDYPLLDPNGGPSAITDGWLCPIRQKYVTVEELNFDDISCRGGDFVDAALERELVRERILHRLTSPTMQLSDGQTLVFAAGVKQASRMTEIFNRYKPASSYCLVSRCDKDDRHDAVVFSHDKQDRRRMLENFSKGSFQFAVNVGCLTEGFDSPSVRTLSIGRMTRSRSLYAQMVGRGTRVLPNVIEGDGWRFETPDERKAAIADSDKPYVTVLDFVGNSRHSLVSAADILGGSYDDDVVERAKDNAKTKDERDEVDVAEELRKAAEEVRVEKEKRARIKATAKVKSRSVDIFGTLGVVSTREPGWHKGRQATTKQRQALEKFKIEPHTVESMSFHQASQALDSLVDRSRRGLATYKQCKLLRKHNVATKELTLQKASYLIGRLARNNWRHL